MPLSIGLRRYPGDAPGIVIDIDPEQQIVLPHAPAATQPVPFAALNTFLERYYAHNRLGERIYLYRPVYPSAMGQAVFLLCLLSLRSGNGA